MRLRTKLSILVSIIVILSFGITFYRTSSFQNELVISQAERQARMLAQQILLTRQWVADHDGLFFIKKPGVTSNPFLEGSDIQDREGRIYVKRNPAMVTRELSKYASEADFCRFRVTSLKPVNPDNAPDEFERQGLLNFEKGRAELIDIVNADKGRLLRYMIPLPVEESCLTCHARHGYQVGDIRGALSMVIPIAWADDAINANNLLLLIIGAITILVTAMTIYLLIDLLVVRRLALLSKAMANFPARDISSLDLPSGNDEIGELSNNFSKLGDRLLTSQTELHIAREQMFQHEKMAAIGQLAAGIAHEVNNPLSGMRNCVKSLQEDPENVARQERYLGLIDKGLQRIGQIVRQLLNFSRKEPLRPRQINIDEVIRECFELLDYQLKDIDLNLDLNLTTSHLVDAGALKQALLNIGLNGAQSMVSGGTLTVSSKETDKQVILAITDTGLGIEPEDIDHIFEPFFTTKSQGEGTGLGLSVSFSLVKRMGGNISVESVIGEGTTFRIEIPKNPDIAV
ncbi:MAG: ATP-binding protein [Thermodesulfobacteriota bacterium]